MRRIDDIEVSERYPAERMSKKDIAVRIVIYFAANGGAKGEDHLALYGSALDHLHGIYKETMSREAIEALIWDVADVFKRDVFTKADIDFFLE